MENRQKNLELIAKITKLGFWEFDLKTKKMFWSKELHNLLGLQKAKPGRIRHYIYKEDLPVYRKALKELINGKEVVEGNVRLVRRDKKVVHCSFKAVLSDDKLIGTFQDMTSFFEIEDTLNKAKNKAEELNMAKSYFLAQASHDLRQPLQALKIFAYNMLQEKLEKNQVKIAEKINSAANNLSHLLDNFLDISKIESGGISLDKKIFDISELLYNIAEEMRITTHKDIEIKYVPSSFMIETDPILVERIIRNLLSNAIKYTKNKIVIGVKSRKNGYSIIIMDNGCGIAKKDLPYIFNEFYQSDEIKDNKKQGAGLGLPIVKKLALLLGADIRVKSEPNKGSCFIVRL